MALTCDVHRFRFESAGALEIVNEYSGLAVTSAHLYRLRRSQHACPTTINLAHGRDVMRSDKPIRYTVHVGIDWADKKHDVCIVPPGEGLHEFDQVPHQVRAIDNWIRSIHSARGLNAQTGKDVAERSTDTPVPRAKSVFGVQSCREPPALQSASEAMN